MDRLSKSKYSQKPINVVSSKSQNKSIESEEENKVLFPNKSRCDKNQKKVVSEESGNKHIVNNPNQIEVYQYHIDGDIISKEDTSGERCDYIVESTKQSKPIAYIIELKGSDMLKAIHQIEATIKRFSQQLANYEIYPRIVCTRIVAHAILDSKFQNFKQKYPLEANGSKIISDSI